MAVEEHQITWFAAMTTYFGYVILIVFGHTRDFFGRLSGKSRYFGTKKQVAKGISPLLASWENFYTRRLYHRIQDCWNRPISGPPGASINVIERNSKDGNCTLETNETKTQECVNLGSYNYLGFADDWMSTCGEPVLGSLEDFSVSCCSAREDAGYTALHQELEELVASFLGKEAALVYNMGYGTNSSTIPAMMGKGSLIISDALNHTSIVNGARASGAVVKVFKHDDPKNLEKVLRHHIVQGQPRTHRPWSKILVMVEGIYSMEGEIGNLPAIVKVAKKYKAYLYVDEAHSVGALGASGRGICEQTGVDPADIDILMGTFTKSFGAMGGYVAGSKQFIQYLRRHSHGSTFGNAMSPIIAKQTITAFRVIMGELLPGVGAKKLQDLKDNANFFRQGLMDMGCEVLGDFDSPVIPVMLYNPAKIAAFSRECYARGLAVVVVGFPATPLVSSRARFCISAGHNRDQLAKTLKVIDEVCDLLKLKYRHSTFG
jgi:serine palmitoyltransferase